MPRILTLLVFVCPVVFGQERNFREDALIINKLMLDHHYAPATIDNRFSQEVFDNFMAALDADKLFFTAGEVDELSAYRFLLDEELNGKGWMFLPTVTKTYRHALERSIKIIEELLLRPLAFNTEEKLKENRPWAANEHDLKIWWSQELKYSFLSRLAEYHRDIADEKQLFREKEAEARRRTLGRAVRSLRRILDHTSGFSNHVGEVYLQTLATAFDPHSAYLSSNAIENFIASLSTEGYFFGFSLNENDRGEIVIETLNPGGPAWRSGLLNRGDVIRELWWEGQQPIAMEDAVLDEVESILLEDNHATLHIKVMKAGGTVSTVSLVKEKITNDQNIVKSFILQGSSKIGYISLPGFYTDWGEKDVAKCANDVATEILKLRKENIEGLIFDLRFNGGGSLFEAVSMAGIFIDAGAIAVLKTRTAENVIKDVNRGTVYDGPLVVMVNGMSASASELLAATLQDYHRAIIVGSNTFGKATAQSLFPLKRNVSPNKGFEFYPGTSYASITIERIYRVTGSTAQLTGVRPDILLPDIYDSLSFRENSIRGALPADSIAKKTYYRPLEPLPIAYLKAQSDQRIATSVGFSSIVRASHLLARSSRENNISLNPQDFFGMRRDWDNELVYMENASPLTGSFSVSHHAFDAQHMLIDASVAILNESWKAKLLQDAHLEEAFHIIVDYVKIKNQK